MLISPDRFPSTSPLIASDLEQQLSALFDKLQSDVKLSSILGNDAKSAEMGAFLNHIVALSPRLCCQFSHVGSDAALEAAMDASLLPAVGVSAPGQVPRMIFHGVPGGKEFTSFAAAILTAGGASKLLDKYTLKDIAKIKQPMVLQVCVSLGCQHCAQLVSSAHRVAWENPLVTAHMIDANLYPQLVKDYDIQRVPLTVIDRKTAIPGGKTMAELTTLLAKY